MELVLLLEVWASWRDTYNHNRFHKIPPSLVNQLNYPGKQTNQALLVQPLLDTCSCVQNGWILQQSGSDALIDHLLCASLLQASCDGRIHHQGALPGCGPIKA